jgi:hypothetical protein
MGYRIALWRDEARKDPVSLSRLVDMLAFGEGYVGGKYPGYAIATNILIKDVMSDEAAKFFVIGGDDVFPDTTKRADEIAAECEDYFLNLHGERVSKLPHPVVLNDPLGRWPTFGVMQPTGDRWGDKNGPYIERVAGSAWIGREFALRAYGGNGPLWPEYFHMYPDEELQLVAQKLGVFWQRPDLTQIHQHWGRPKEGETMGHSHNMPEFLKRANSDKEWDAAKKLFEARKAAGFPGHEVKA